MTEITYQITAEDIASRSLRVTVPVEQLAEVERRAAKDYAKSVSLPGFRKGQAPEAMIRRRFAVEIKRYVVEEAMRMGWQKVLEETGLQPISDPQVRNVAMEEGEPLGFDVTIEIRPDLKLTTTGGFSLTRTLPQVSEEALTAQLDRLREDRAAWEPIEGTKPAPGHLANVTVTSLESDAPPGTPYEFILGEGRALPALEEQIMTLLPGGSVETNLRYPDDHPDENRRGADRPVKIELHGVKAKALSPLDDAFAREVGEGAFEDLAALVAAVRADLEAEAAKSSDQQLRDALIQQLAEANGVPAPHGLTHRLMHAYAEAYRIEPEQFEAFEASFQPIAEAQVKRELIIQSVATAQNLHANEADVDARVAEMATLRGVEPGKLYASLQQGKRLGELERALTEERVFQWLLEQSTISEGVA